MLRNSMPYPAIYRFSLFPRLLFLAFLWSWGASQAAVAELKNPVVQFTAAGHVLGFQPDGLYVASGDHMLHVGFVGTKGAVPAAANPSDDHKATPLTQVSYTDLWPGIDLRYEAVGGGIIQSTWTVRAGADPKRIRLRYNAPLAMAADGGLKIRYATGWMHESAPMAWQEIAGHRRPIEVAFRLLDTPANAAVVGFKLGHYDPDYPLLIDPTLAWNTFMGASDWDFGTAIAVGGSGAVYVAGWSNASWGTPLNAHAGGTDAFVAKLNANGARQWHTFLGSAGTDYGTAIAVDGSGNVYVAGSSDATWGEPVKAHAGDDDAFAAKLAADGRLLWHTFLGSFGPDSAYGIAVDDEGKVYVTGYSIAGWGGSPVNGHAGLWDAFAVRLNADGEQLWHTFMGSASNDVGYAIAVDSDSDVYVAGYSLATWGTPVNAHAGLSDAFVARLDADDGTRLWHTFMGSIYNDEARAIAVDGQGSVYVAGISRGTWGTPVNPYAGAEDTFAAKLDANGTLMWNTFMPSESGTAIAVDARAHVYVAGTSAATWGTPLTAFAGSLDAFVAELTATGARLWHTFMGSKSQDNGNALAVDGSGNIYLAGTSSATWGTPLNAHAGSYDAFVAKLRDQDYQDCSFYIIKSRNGKVVAVCL